MEAPEQSKEVAELKQAVNRWKTWYERVKNDYATLKVQFDELQEENARLTRERDELLGDNTKLKAQIDEYASALEAARCSERAWNNPAGIIIRP